MSLNKFETATAGVTTGTSSGISQHFVLLHGLHFDIFDGHREGYLHDTGEGSMEQATFVFPTKCNARNKGIETLTLTNN
jgi:hypothetical protein